MASVGVILFNLGGPDSLTAVRPFLFNLFYDCAIIDTPNPMRWGIAQIISRLRTKSAQEIYKKIGNSSPIVPETKKQQEALEHLLTKQYPEDSFRVFTVMRYWHPFAKEVVKEVKDFNPDKIILLPLYPHYSTTTTQSSFKDWMKACQKEGLKKETIKIKYYYENEGFIKAYADKIYEKTQKLDPKEYRILFSAHGLPKQIVEKRQDPYPEQIKASSLAVLDKLKSYKQADYDYVICYQSRVGPVEWIKPYTSDEIKKAGKEGKSLVIIPIAFVGEHSETLVELDDEYKKLALENGVPHYYRISAVSIHPDFIQGLSNLVGEKLQKL